MKKLALFALVLLFGTVGTAAAQDEGRWVKILAFNDTGEIVFQDALINADNEVLLAGTQCNGGSCATDTGVVLNCPTSAGPNCSTRESCICRCKKAADGTWSAANMCVPRITSVEIDDELEPEADVFDTDQP